MTLIESWWCWRSQPRVVVDFRSDDFIWSTAGLEVIISSFVYQAEEIVFVVLFFFPHFQVRTLLAYVALSEIISLWFAPMEIIPIWWNCTSSCDFGYLWLFYQLSWRNNTRKVIGGLHSRSAQVRPRLINYAWRRRIERKRCIFVSETWNHWDWGDFAVNESILHCWCEGNPLSILSSRCVNTGSKLIISDLVNYLLDCPSPNPTKLLRGDGFPNFLLYVNGHELFADDFLEVTSRD